MYSCFLLSFSKKSWESIFQNSACLLERSCSCTCLTYFSFTYLSKNPLISFFYLLIFCLFSWSSKISFNSLSYWKNGYCAQLRIFIYLVMSQDVLFFFEDLSSLVFNDGVAHQGHELLSLFFSFSDFRFSLSFLLLDESSVLL